METETKNEFETAHDALTNTATFLSCSASSLIGSISRHVLPDTISFNQLEALHASAKMVHKTIHATDFVATSANDMIFSVKLGAYTHEADAPTSSTKKKRKRDRSDDQLLQAQAMVSKLKKNVPPNIPNSEVEMAEAILTRLIRDMRGPANEIVVESFLIVIKKLREDDARASIVLGARLAAGVPIPLQLLKTCLGTSWSDGLLTSKESAMGIPQADLPLSEEGAASARNGNTPLLLVTSVAKERG